MENQRDRQTRSESKTRLLEQINICLRSGDYSHALDLLRSTSAEFPDDVERSALERLAQDGLKRKAEADRLITESQELFAQRNSAEAIKLLRKAYELDRKNSLARAILANSLVEQANSVVETDWLEAETLTNQALDLNPAHPTAKTIRSLIIDQKKNSSVEDWVAKAGKLQSSGDLFAALAWVAEGLAVHPDDPKLLQMQDAIQRDQSARRRQARRGDLEDLRRMERDIDRAADAAAKHAISDRIQAVAAKHWTDGEILSIANALLLRLGLVSQESSSALPRGKSATLILHVPRHSAPEASSNAISQVLPSPVVPNQVVPSPVLPSKAPGKAIPPVDVTTGIVPPSKVPPRVVPPGKVLITPPEQQLPSPQTATLSATEPDTRTAKITLPSSLPKQRTKSSSTTLIVVSTAAIILVAAVFFLVRQHHTPAVAETPAAAPNPSAHTISTAASAPALSAPPDSAPAPTTPEPSQPAGAISSDTVAERVMPDDQPSTEASRKLGTLLVVAGQDNARVFLNGKLQRQLTQSGQLLIPNLELKDYVVQVSKSGFQDPPQQEIRIRQGEQTKLVFNLQPQLRVASLIIQGGSPGTTVLVDQAVVGTIQSDGTFSVSTVNAGDHVVELRKERFKSRQFKEHFVAGGAISLIAADAALEATPAVLKITFTPVNANVALVEGNLLKIVSSGVPLNLVPGTYTLTARTAERFTRTSTLEAVAGQSKILDLSLAPSGMANWDDPGAWKHEGDSFVRKGGDFVLYGVAPASGTFVFSAMLTKGHLLQWVLNYTDPKNCVLFQMDDNNFYRTVIHNGEKTDEIKVPDKSDKKSFRTLQVRVSPAELVHLIKHGESWTVLDRWAQPGTNLSLGKFGFYLPGNDQLALSSFAYYVDLNIH